MTTTSGSTGCSVLVMKLPSATFAVSAVWMLALPRASVATLAKPR